MSIKLRRILFYIFLAVFLITSPLIIAYAEGWRINYTTWNLEKTGGIFLEGYPSRAIIFINSEPIQHETGLFKKGLLIDDLAPGTYTIHIENAHGLAWKKVLDVYSSHVSRATKIVIPQKNAVSLTLKESIKDFIVKGDTIIGILNKNEIRAYNIQDLGKTSYIKIIGEKIIAVSPNGKNIVTQTKNGSYFLTNLLNSKSVLNITTLTETLKPQEKIKAINSHPYHNQEWILTFESGAYILQIKNSILVPVIKTPHSLLVNTTKNEAFFITPASTSPKNYNIISYNFLTNDLTLITSSTTSTPEKVIVAQNTLYILNSQNEFMAIELNNRKRIVIKERDVKDIILGREERKIALIKQKEIVIYYIEKEDQDYIVNEDESIHIPLTKTQENPTKVIWYNDDAHLMLQSHSGLFLLEIDPRPPRNIWTINENTEPIDYDPEKNKVYFIDNKNLYELDMGYESYRILLNS